MYRTRRAPPATPRASPTPRGPPTCTISGLANFPIGAGDNVLPVVPMFHAAAWGYPFCATTAGAKITYGARSVPQGDRRPDRKGAGYLLRRGADGVAGIAQYLAEHPEADVSSIQGFLCGGSAVPRAMIDWYWRNRRIRVIQGWGMTETNPVASTATLTPEMEDWDFEQQLDRLETAGRPLRSPGEDRRRTGRGLPQDGEAFGELLIRGPWVAAEYLNDHAAPRPSPTAG